MSRTDYDDEAEVTRYVWDYHPRLMTESEQRVGRAHFAELKAAAGARHVAEWILRRHGITGDPAADAALAGGVEGFRRRVCRRELSEHSDQIVINRCPACHGVARTPQAKQCFWCGHDWH